MNENFSGNTNGFPSTDDSNLAGDFLNSLSITNQGFPTAPPQKKKSYLGLFIGLGAAFLAVIIAVVLFFILGNFSFSKKGLSYLTMVWSLLNPVINGVMPTKTANWLSALSLREQCGFPKVWLGPVIMIM